MSQFHNNHEILTDKIYEGSLELPHRYVFVLTNICNLNCHFCFQNRDRRDDAMTADDWLNLLNQLPDYARVTFTGGEPLAFKEFEKVAGFALNKFNCNMITNGLLLKPQKIDFILSHSNFRVLSISIDDIGNKNRDVTEGQWQRLLSYISYFHEQRQKLDSQCVLDVKTVVLDSNIDDLFEIHRYCVEVLKVDTHAFQLLKGNPLQHADIMFRHEKMHAKCLAPTYEKFDKLYCQFEKIRKYNLTSKAQTFIHPKLFSFESENPIPDFRYINESKFNPSHFELCKFPWSSVHINVDGALFPCMAIEMGNVKNQKLTEIISGEKFSLFKSELKNKLVEGCNRCGWLRPACTK